MKHKADTCVVCGARARRFFGDTCDSTCKRAKVTGRTRAGQITAEIHAADRASRASALAAQFANKDHRFNTDVLDYNRPYMNEATA